MNCEINLSPGEKMKNPPLNAGKKISTGPEKVYSLLVYQLIHKISNHTWMGSTKCPRKNKWHHPHPLIKNSFPGGTNRIPPSALSGALTDLSKPCRNHFVNLASKNEKKKCKIQLKSVKIDE